MAFWATCKIAQPIQPIWQHIFAMPWSALKRHRGNSISSIFLESPDQVEMKNIVKFWKDFLPYFTTLETYRDKAILLLYIIQ